MKEALTEKTVGEGFAFFCWIALNGRGNRVAQWVNHYHIQFWNWGYR